MPPLYIKRPISLFAVILALLCSATAAEINPNQPARICVIGAGIAGASAAHFLSQEYCAPTPSNDQKTSPPPSDTKRQIYYSRRACKLLIFERSNKIGGRIASVVLDPQHNIQAEAGASIIHPKNELMIYFREFLGLKTAPNEHDDGSFGLYDGDRFVHKSFGTLKDSVKILFRYNLSLWRMNKFVDSLLNRFARLYGNLDGGFETVKSFLKRTDGLYELALQHFPEVVRDIPLSQKMIDELVTAIMRVNYNQRVSDMNGFVGAVSLAGAADGLWKVKGGNSLIPQGLIRVSNATVFFNKGVSRIIHDEHSSAQKGYPGYILTFGDSAEEQQNCDAVIIAAPIGLSKLHLPNAFKPPPTVQTYARTVATFIKGRIRPDYFQERPECESCIPSAIFAVGESSQFSGISRIPVDNANSSASQFFKIFSELPPEKSLLDQLFKHGYQVIKTFDWLAYPQYTGALTNTLPFKFADNVFYCNTVESLASAMEMSALAGQNTAALAAESLSLTGMCKAKLR